MTYKQPFLDRLAEPFVRVFARPAFMRFNRLILDLAYRLNGFGTWYPDRTGLPKGETQAIEKYLTTYNPSVVFDVGANRGDFANHVRHLLPNTTIHCFEPQPHAVHALHAALSDDKIIINDCAVSDCQDTMTLYDYEGDGFSTIASLNKEAVTAFTENVRSFDVTVTTIDAYCDQHAITAIDLLKIDTEGYDLNVLRGARRMLTTGKIAAVSFEFIPANLKTHVFFYEIMEELKGFNIFRIMPNGLLYLIDDYIYRYCEIFVPSSYIALKKD